MAISKSHIQMTQTQLLVDVLFVLLLLLEEVWNEHRKMRHMRIPSLSRYMLSASSTSVESDGL